AWANAGSVFLHGTYARDVLAKGTGLAHIRRGSRLPPEHHPVTNAGTASLHSNGVRHMAWIILFIAGLFEIGWAIGLKYTDGFSRPVPTALTAASMVVSVILLGMAMRSLPVGTAYAVWTGIGTVG